MLVHRRVIPSIKFAGTHLYIGWSEALSLCLAQLEPGPLDPESSSLTMRPPRLPYFICEPCQNFLIKFLFLLHNIRAYSMVKQTVDENNENHQTGDIV